MRKCPTRSPSVRGLARWTRGVLWITPVFALAAVGGCPGPATDSAALLQPRTDDHVLAVGSPLLTVIEYGDFECPYCGEFARDTFPAFKARYIDTGQVRWVYRHLPLNNHPRAEPAAEASGCAAAQGRFWEYQDLLFHNQDALAEADLEGYAAQLGLDLNAFGDCLSSGAEAARVARDVQAAGALGAFVTPTFFIGTTRVDGSLSLDEISTLVEQALAQAATAGTPGGV